MSFSWIDDQTLFVLHASDFHVGKDGHGQDVLFRELLEEIEKTVAEKREPDLVFITGDIANKGTEYQRFVDDFLEPLRKLVPGSQVFMVPGNHDVNREAAKYAHRGIVMDVPHDFFDPTTKGKKERDHLAPRFDDYINALSAYTPCDWLTSELGSYARVLELRGFRVGILLLNTAWLAGSDGEKGKLRLTPDMVRAGLKQLDDAQMVLVLGHHPLSWLHEEDQTRLSTLFGQRNALYFSGHVHKGQGKRCEGAGEDFWALGAGAAFQAREHPLWVNGFQWYGLAPASGELRVHPCKWNADHQEWVTDTLAFPKKRKCEGGEWWKFEIPAIDSPTSEAVAQPATATISDAEEAYLRLNLPNWSMGRSRSGGGFQGVEEIYEARSYVPLDGLTHRFHYDEETDCLTPHEDKCAEGERMEQGSLRQPLGWWASRPELGWTVLSGSPGAGKTVFLTRLAASLAHRLLEESVEAEPHVNPDAMGKPIPVTLEAHTLAQGKMETYADLVAAVHAELNCTKYMAAQVSEQEIATGLDQGRYVLLIDALDEVPKTGDRRRLLCWLKGLKSTLAKTRVLLTTRSARYTGDMPFGPEFEPVELTDLSEKQMNELCKRFCEIKGQGQEFQERLQHAIHTVGECARQGSDETNLVGNPLLLHTACSVFFKRNHLPENRASLCSDVVEHLCRARTSQWEGSEDRKDWKLGPVQKQNLLERIAYGMQVDKAQQWPIAKVYSVVRDTLPQQQRSEQQRLDQYIKWLVAHTGLIHFQGSDHGECIRFHHRLFREYLTACRLKKEDKLLKDQIQHLHKKEWLTDPFWLDVVRLLPGAIADEDKARTIGEEMLALADSDKKMRGRLLGTLCAAVVENKDLFQKFDRSQLVKKCAVTQNAEGQSWDIDTNILLLEQMGWLGDPRLDFWSERCWVQFIPAAFGINSNKKVNIENSKDISPFWVGRYPVTNSQYHMFIRDDGYRNEEFWTESGWQWLSLKGNGYNEWFEYIKKKYRGDGWNPNMFQPGDEPLYWIDNKFNHPSQPVVGVSWHEADAFCRWLGIMMNKTKPEWARNTSLEVALPTEVEWAFAARGLEGRRFPWGENPEPDPFRANYYNSRIKQTTPVGAYHSGSTPEGIHDMAGNVWEWCADVFEEDPPNSWLQSEKESINGGSAMRVLRGGSWRFDAESLPTSYRDWEYSWNRNYSCGFRCVIRQV